MADAETDVTFELAVRVATLTLNRPNKLNARSEPMIAGAPPGIWSVVSPIRTSER